MIHTPIRQFILSSVLGFFFLIFPLFCFAYSPDQQQLLYSSQQYYGQAQYPYSTSFAQTYQPASSNIAGVVWKTAYHVDCSSYVSLDTPVLSLTLHEGNPNETPFYTQEYTCAWILNNLEFDNYTDVYFPLDDLQIYPNYEYNADLTYSFSFNALWTVTNWFGGSTYGENYTDGSFWHYYPSSWENYSGNDTYFIVIPNQGTQTYFTAPEQTYNEGVADWIEMPTYIFEGVCPTDGSNRLALLDTFEDNCTFLNSIVFNIDCSSGTFTHASNVNQNLNDKWIIDKEYVNQRCVEEEDVDTGLYKRTLYRGYESGSHDWGISINYPTDDGSHYFTVKPLDDWSFNFAYRIPDEGLASTTLFSVMQMLSSTSTTILATPVTDHIDDFDPDLIGSFTPLGIDIADSTTYYFRASLLYDSAVQYEMRFTVVGSSSATIESQGTTTEDMGWVGNALRSAFVPKQKFMKDYIDSIPDILSSKKPFSYFYQMYDVLASTTVSSTPLALNFSIPIVGEDATVTMPFLDTSESHLTSFLNSSRPYLIYALWIMFGLFCFERIADFEI